MQTFRSALAGLGLAILITASAGAATFNATSLTPNGDFSITFDDLNSDGLLQIGEITGFSGFHSLLSGQIVAVLSVPEIAGFATSGAMSGASVLMDLSQWSFETEGHVDLSWDFAAPAAGWSYAISPSTSAVPLPGALPLALAGLGIGGMVARRKARRG